MAASRPCRHCRNLFIPRGPGRPPKYCPACRDALRPSPDPGLPDPDGYWQRIRDEIRTDDPPPFAPDLDLIGYMEEPQRGERADA